MNRRLRHWALKLPSAQKEDVPGNSFQMNRSVVGCMHVCVMKYMCVCVCLFARVRNYVLWRECHPPELARKGKQFISEQCTVAKHILVLTSKRLKAVKYATDAVILDLVLWLVVLYIL